MTDAEGTPVPHRAVVVGVIPDHPPRVLKEAARYATLFGAPLIVAHVDITRFVTYADPDGYVQPASLDLDIAAGEAQLARVRDAATTVPLSTVVAASRTRASSRARPHWPTHASRTSPTSRCSRSGRVSRAC